MRSTIIICAAALGLALAAPSPAVAQGKPDRPPSEKQKERAPKARGQGQRPDHAGPPAQAQARGQGQGQERARGQGQARGRGPAARAGEKPGGGPPAHARARRGGPAPDLAAFNRDVVNRAVSARARRHGEAPRVTVRSQGQEIRVVRDDGRLLFALDRQAADELGYWRAGVVSPYSPEPRRDRERGGIFDGLGDDDARRGPAFCRSGEGHPVWGREWCVDKGFGLGDGGGLWGRAGGIDDVIFRRPRTDREQLDRATLADVLGDIVFGRLALQSLVLGAQEPLTGRWLGDRDGPRILRVRAGDLVVAELVDGNRDDQVDVVLFNLGS